MRIARPSQSAIPTAARWLGLSLVVASASCRESPTPSSTTTSPAASQPASAALTDHVRHPRVDPAERNAPRLRLVSMAPRVTETICALGMADWLVGRTTYCNWPPEVRDVPALGALVDTNVEALAALRPDLIVLSGRSGLQAERLRGAGLRFESVPDVGLADVFAAARRIGDLTGRRRTADALCDAVQADLEAVARRYRSARGASVLIVVGVLGNPPAAPFSAGPGSFYDEMLTLLGARNAAKLDAAFGPLSLEVVVATDPDVIVELDPDGAHRPGGDADAVAAWARVGDLAAVRRGRVRVLVGPQHYLAGPRIAETADALGRAISPP